MMDVQAEFGRPTGRSPIPATGFASASQLVCSYADRDGWHLGSLDTRTRRLTTLALPYSQIEQVHVTGRSAVFLGGSPVEPMALVSLDLDTHERFVLATSSAAQLDAGYLSEPEAIEFQTDGGLTAHGLFYSPRNRDFVGPHDERPPLRVISHDGPTDAASRALQLAIQFWTSRGISVLDVNYGGSSG